MNNLVATLAEEVPFVRNCPRRLDKTAILRLSASYLKLHHGTNHFLAHHIMKTCLCTTQIILSCKN